MVIVDLPPLSGATTHTLWSCSTTTVARAGGGPRAKRSSRRLAENREKTNGVRQHAVSGGKAPRSRSRA